MMATHPARQISTRLSSLRHPKPFGWYHQPLTSLSLVPTSLQLQQQEQQQSQQRRDRHSSRQIKRFLKNHHAMKRRAKRQLEERMELDPNFVPPPPPEPLQPTYPPVYENFTMLPNGWSAPPPTDTFELPDYPFGVQRTGNKPNGAVGFLPVYSDSRSHGSKKLTIVRKVSGDHQAFVREVAATLGMTSDDMEKKIRIKSGGSTIEIDGRWSKDVRSWLAGLGF